LIGSRTIGPVLLSGCSPPHPTKGPASFGGGPTDPHCWPPSGLQSPKRSFACRESIGRRPLRRDEVLAKDRLGPQRPLTPRRSWLRWSATQNAIWSPRCTGSNCAESEHRGPASPTGWLVSKSVKVSAGHGRGGQRGVPPRLLWAHGGAVAPSRGPRRHEHPGGPSFLDGFAGGGRAASGGRGVDRSAGGPAGPLGSGAAC